MQQNISYKAFKVKIKQNKEGEQNFYRKYGKGLKKTQMRLNKSVQDLKKETFKIYNIEAQWQ